MSSSDLVSGNLEIMYKPQSLAAQSVKSTIVVKDNDVIAVKK